MVMQDSPEFACPSLDASSHGDADADLRPSRDALTPQKRNASGRPKTKVTRACDTCKSKKSKCSGELPCESCKQRNLKCSYKAHYSRGKAPVPRPAVVTRDSVEEDAANDRAAETPSQVSDFLPRPFHVPAVASRASPVLDIAGYYSEPTSGISFLSRAWQRITNGENSNVIEGQTVSIEDDQLLQSAGDKPLPPPHEVDLPSFRRGLELIELYFDVCIATYRIIHRPTTEAWLASVVNKAAAHRPLHEEIGRAKAAVVLSIFAVASFHEEKTRDDGYLTNMDLDGQSDQFFIMASQLTESETGFPKLESAQCRLIQVLYLLMTCRFNSAWYRFGSALQIISAMGLHRKTHRVKQTTDNKKDYLHDQCKKRVFWTAYTLDKYLGVIFGRPRHFHDDDIDQDLPDAVNDEDMTSDGPIPNWTSDCHTSALIHHAKLAMIAEKISREIYSIKPVANQTRLAASRRLGEELRLWNSNLPPFLGAINPNSLIPRFRRQAIALRLSYCHAVILAQRPLLLTRTTQHHEDMDPLTKEGLFQCTNAAHTVLETVNSMAKEGRMFHAFWWTQYICFCALAVVYVWAITDSNNPASLDERCMLFDKAECCSLHLAQATATHSPSRRYSIILQELRAEAKRKTGRGDAEQAAQGDVLPHVMTESISEHARPLGQGGSHIWEPAFANATDTVTPDIQNVLEDWQTVDWLQLDASAFALMPDLDPSSVLSAHNI